MYNDQSDFVRQFQILMMDFTQPEIEALRGPRISESQMDTRSEMECPSSISLATDARM
jgi:hypothetical protein